MSTESDRICSGSDAVNGVNASRSDVGNDHVSETLANHLTSQAEELVAKRDGDEREGCITVELECGSVAASDDQGMKKRNGFADLERQTESVSEGLDQGIGTHNEGVGTNESEKKCPVGNVEKEVEPDVVCSHGANLGEVKGSDGGLDFEDTGQDRDSDDSKNEGKKVENLDLELSAGLESDECKDESLLDDIKGSDGRLDCEDIGEDRDSDDSKNQGKKADNLDVEFSADVESDECKDDSVLDDVKAPVTANLKPFDSDLVWAKVRSHPWWPGQVFDPSAATEKAKKHLKKGRFLVAYFGDCTFAWNDESKIKPFRQHFTEMEKQNNMSEFLDAVDCALEEVSRRIEFGLACPCISKEVYEKIKTQNIINPGIREDSCRKHGADEVSSAVSFEPANLLEYVKILARSPSYDTTDNLQLVCQKARLLAFYRWKGFTDLAEFETLQGSVESAAKISPTKGKNNSFQRKASIPEPKPTKQVYSKRRKTEDHDGVFEYEDTTALIEKEMTLAEFIAEKRLSRSNENKSHENPGNNPHFKKKRKAKVQTDDPGSSNSTKKVKEHNLSAADTVTPQKGRSGFGIGASILRAANQMHCSTPTRLNPCSHSDSKLTTGNNGNRNSTQTRPKARDLDQVTEETACTNLPEDIKNSESRDLEDSSKEQMLHSDRKETAKIAGEFHNNDSNLTEQNITDSDFKDQPSNKNCSVHSSSSSKEDISKE